MEAKRAAARGCYRRAASRTAGADDSSTAEQVDRAATALRDAMTGTFDKHSRKKRWCTRSKRWWTSDLAKLGREVGGGTTRASGHRTCPGGKAEPAEGDPAGEEGVLESVLAGGGGERRVDRDRIHIPENRQGKPGFSVRRWNRSGGPPGAGAGGPSGTLPEGPARMLCT